MKFSDGFWLNKPGYEINYACEPYEIHVSDHAIHVVATHDVITSRGQTLDGPVLDITFASTLENTIKVTIEHFRGGMETTPEFQLYEDDGFFPMTVETDEYAELISGKARVRINKIKGWSIEYYYGDKLLTKEGWRTTSYITEQPYHTQERMLAQQNFNRFYADDQDPRPSYMREMLNLSVGESVYGFGEKFTTFVKNGQSVQIWNGDGGTCSEYSYKSIPFYVSNRGYGVFVNHSEKVEFEVASDTVSKVSIVVPGEKLQYFIIGGENIADVISNYTTLTGKPALPPAYSFGLWLTTSFTTNYDEEDGLLLHRRHGGARYPASGVPLRLLLDAGVPLVQLRRGTSGCSPIPRASSQRLKARGHPDLRLDQPLHRLSTLRLFDEGVRSTAICCIKKTTATSSSAICGSPAWQSLTLPIPKPASGTRQSCAHCARWALTLSRPTSVREYPQPTLHTVRRLRSLQECTTTTPISTTSAYSSVLERILRRRTRLACSHVLLRSAVSSSPYTGAATASASTSQWLKHSVAAFRSAYQAFGYFSHDISGFEATGSPRPYTRDGSAFGLMSSHSQPSARQQLIQRAVATLTKKRATFCATSQSLKGTPDAVSVR